MIKNSLLKVSIAMTLMLATGCSEAEKPLAPSAPKPQPKSDVTGTAAQPKQEVQPEEVYAYNPAGRRDPFTPIIIKEEKKALGGTKTPLERYPINEFKLAGIVWGGLGYHAMLEGPDGKGYFVKVGTVIGPNRGVIRKITQNTMIIEEKFKDPTGQVDKREVVIELRKKQEGTP